MRVTLIWQIGRESASDVAIVGASSKLPSPSVNTTPVGSPVMLGGLSLILSTSTVTVVEADSEEIGSAPASTACITSW